MNIDLLISVTTNVLNPLVLLAILVGVSVGIFVGALPGLTGTMGVALLLPITFGMEPEIGLPMLMAIYCGSLFGGSISAILICIPGTGAAAATVLDGYPMAQKGEGGKAIGYALVASFIGGIFSAIALLFIAPPLSRLALLFGPPEFFTLALLGLTLIGTLSKGDWNKGLLSGSIGLLLSTVGMDALKGEPRFVFGQVHLLSGITFIPALIGLFSLSQGFILLGRKMQKKKKSEKVSGRIWPTLSELSKVKKTIFRSSIIGTIIGIIPGTGGDIATWVGYNEAKRNSKDTELFGTGIPEGVVASEAANNAVSGGAMIPLMTLGIPGSSTTAVILGGMLALGLRPGVTFMSEYRELSLTLIFSLFIANIAMLIVGYGAAKVGVYITRIESNVLAPIIIVLSVIGSYAIGNSLFDIGLMCVFGIIGYVMHLYEFPLAPVVIGLILGPIAERGLRQSLLISRGNWSIFFTRPLSAILLGFAILSLYSAIRKKRKNI